MEKRFSFPFCPLEFIEEIRLERHVAKDHKKKEIMPTGIICGMLQIPHRDIFDYQ